MPHANTYIQGKDFEQAWGSLMEGPKDWGARNKADIVWYWEEIKGQAWQNGTIGKERQLLHKAQVPPKFWRCHLKKYDGMSFLMAHLKMYVRALQPLGVDEGFNFHGSNVSSSSSFFFFLNFILWYPLLMITRYHQTKILV